MLLALSVQPTSICLVHGLYCKHWSTTVSWISVFWDSFCLETETVSSSKWLLYFLPHYPDLCQWLKQSWVESLPENSLEGTDVS